MTMEALRNLVALPLQRALLEQVGHPEILANQIVKFLVSKKDDKTCVAMFKRIAITWLLAPHQRWQLFYLLGAECSPLARWPMTPRSHETSQSSRLARSFGNLLWLLIVFFLILFLFCSSTLCLTSLASFWPCRSYCLPCDCFDFIPLQHCVASVFHHFLLHPLRFDSFAQNWFLSHFGRKSSQDWKSLAKSYGLGTFVAEMLVAGGLMINNASVRERRFG